jgi:toxin ParE1/3/4
MKYNFELSKLALKDLDDIWNYTCKHWSKNQANKYYNELFKVINEICNNEEIGKPIDHIKKGHRIVNVKSHIIIYKTKRITICIDRILHNKMNIEKHLHE